jgi:uncharacterized membrane protein
MISTIRSSDSEGTTMFRILGTENLFFGRVRMTATCSRRARVRQRPSLETLETRSLMASFQGLGTMALNADAVSADGSTVIGNSSYPVGPFYWTQASGVVRLPIANTNGTDSVSGVSGNGSVIVGTIVGASEKAFSWTSSGGAVTPPALSSGTSSTANAISEDGSTIAGDIQEGNIYGYQLTGTTLDVFPQKPPVTDYGTEVTSMSANGAVIAGWYFGAASGSEYAFQWSNGTFIPIPDTTVSSRAAAVSADGSVVVGQLNYESTDPLAFSWTQGNVPTDLPLPSGFTTSAATGVSNNGSAIVGYMAAGTNFGGLVSQTACIWDQNQVAQSLKQVLTTDYGLGTALAGWTLFDAKAITPDGKTIVGTGIDPRGYGESWIVHLNSPTPTPTPTPDVSVASTPNPSIYGQPVTFTATVSAATSGLPTPTGTVIFMDGATVLNPGGAALDTSGIATFSTSSLAVASHSIMAVYSGDSNYSSSTSAPVTQVVNNSPNVTITSVSKLGPNNLVGPQLEFGYQISGIGILDQFTADLYQSAKNTFDNSATLIATQTITVSSSPTGYFNLANVSPNPSQPYLLVVAIPPFGGPPSIANQQSYNYIAPNLITLSQLELIMPGLAQSQAHAFIYALNEALADYSINTPNIIAAFLSQIAAESGQLTMWDQSATGATGTYRGRGPIQLTGLSAYSAAGVYFGIDLVDNPGLLADSVNNYELGFEVSGWYWTYYKSYANLNAAADAIPPKTAANFVAVATFENLDITLVVTGQISLPLLPNRLLTLLNAINILS